MSEISRSALDVANHFVEYSGYTKTHLQIQKMTYIAHGYMLGIHGVPLVKDEVQAWKYGPVFPNLYNEFRKWGSGVIGKIRYSPKPFNGDEYDVMEKVFAWYGRFCGYFLSDITHNNSNDKTPWSQCYSYGHKRPIPNEITKKYYAKLYSERGYEY